MNRVKLVVLIIFAIIAICGCFNSKPARYSITDSKAYEASLFRQHCAICHGPEGEGKTLDDGKVVPNMREGELLKFHTEPEIYKQISAGGNGMTPFRDILTDRELNMMVKFVHDELRKQ
ncbi:MAG TPA: cytochrome c [Pyrinomonadaceae bacterium]|nr:cytochrome c [Pyrinomonadaceae bacterium]